MRRKEKLGTEFNHWIGLEKSSNHPDSGTPLTTSFVANIHLNIEIKIGFDSNMSIESIDWMGRRSCCSCNSSSSSSVPEDLLIEILLCLPIRSLLRFKSVCKSWSTIIESCDFIHRHASTLPPDYYSSKLGTFIFQSHQEIWQRHTYKVFSNIYSISGDHELEPVFEDLGMPPCYRNSPRDPIQNLLMVGSCNGVICLEDDELRDVCLWNPAINQFRVLPKSLTFAGIGEVHQDFVAFGFDVETKDYKVVLVTYFNPAPAPAPAPGPGIINNKSSSYNHFKYPYGALECGYGHSKYPYRVQMYNLSTDSWRHLEDVIMPTYPISVGGYLNGSYYGLGDKWVRVLLDRPTTTMIYNYKLVMEAFSFDFTKEIFRTMHLPDEIMYYSLRYNDFTFLGEKIVIIVCSRDEINNYECTYDLWVLNELGVKESWTKLYTFGPYENSARPIGISNNGEFLFIEAFSPDKKLVLFNPSTQVMKGLQCDGNIVNRVHAYRRSLVPVGGSRNGDTSEGVLCAV